MKKLLYILIFLNYFVSYSQENVYGNSPVQGIIPIKRGDIQENKEIVNRAAAISNNITPSSPTGNSTEVGVTEGQLSVSLTGGATYNIPIAVPPGINSIVPQVSLSYNSQGGNGLAGYGWNVSGVSVITKIPTTKFHDNIIDAVDFNNLDRFAFDGQRLIVKNGTSGAYGANGTVYETESFSNVQITSYGVHPSGANYGPAYFIVQYPDGSIAHYGNSTTSRSLTDWAITYWQNPQGVRISYNYTLSNNNLSISTIRYGTRLTATPINEILFVYKNRTRPEQAYIGGQSFVRSTILSEIKVKGNNIGFRNYLLTHEVTSLGYEKLKSITEKSGDNSKSFNPTVFNYETTSENISFNSNSASLNVNNIRSNNAATVQGDFDGDGNLDIILYPTTGADAKKKYWLFNDIQGTGMNIGSEHNIGSFTSIFPMSWLSWNNKLMPSQGWCAIQTNTTTNTTTFNTYSTGTVSPIYFQYARTYQFPRITNTPNSVIYDIPKEYSSGDFNGDGLTDLIIIEKTFYYTSVVSGITINQSYNGGKAYFLNLDRRITTNYISVAGNFQVTASSKFEVGDFNGDGKSDIFVFDNNFCRVYTLNNTNSFILLTTINSSNINVSKPVLMGDYNGDGKADFIIPKENLSSLFTKYLSTGTSYVSNEADLGIGQYFTGFYNENESTIQYIIPNDFNNDGKTDIIVAKCRYVYSGYTDYVNQSRFISLTYLNNKGTTFESSMYALKQDVNGLNHFPIPVALSFEKANSNKQISFISNNNIYSAVSPKDNLIDTSIKEIVLGNGVKDIITYQTLSSDDFSYDNVFEPSTFTENYPNFDINVANNFKVVSKLDQVSATQNKQQKFKYYGAVSNVEGLGFLGFRGLARTNWFNEDNPIISSISKHDILKRGAVVENYSVLGETYGNFTGYTPTNYINKTNMTYESQLLLNKVYKINNTFTISLNGLENTSKEVSTTYDDNNNPKTTTSLSKNGTTVERTEVVNIEYYPNSSSPTYFVGRLKKKNSSVTHNGDTMTGEEIYIYNPAHLVSKIQKKGHLTNYLTEDNIYDVFGNITQKKITAVGLIPRITNFSYDTSGRFLLTSTDIEGLVTTYTYNTSDGLLLTQTLPSNADYPLTTTCFYDVWGKKIKETDYLGKSLNYSFSWLSAGTNGFFGTNSSGDDNSASFSWFDDLGRKIADGFRTINDESSTESNNSWKTFEYDIYDRVIKTYEPKLSLLPSWEGLYSTTTFDAYGRTTKVVEHTGKTSNINYNGLTTTASDGVSNSTGIKNSLGSIVSMTDNGGTISYQHYANGNLKQSNFGGVIVAIEQDGWGRKTKLIDPSAGTYEYQYNEFGEMKKEITPKGVTIYTLNNFGKVTEKTIVGIGGDTTNNKTTYTYNPTTKLLTNTRYDDFTGGFYTLYSYGYDNYKRINFSDESGFNAYYQRATQYDDFGRPEKELYTAVNTSNSKQSSKWVKNTYKNGNHWQILDDATNQVLWQTAKVDGRGQLTNGSYGNGISVANTYDQYGFPTQFKHYKTGTPLVNVMTLNTDFEPQRGNLTSRYNSMFDHQEDFTYDNLDRLSTWSNNNLIQNFTFTGNTENFEPTTSNAIVLNTNSTYFSRLTVTTYSSFEGTKRIVKNSATIGDVIQFTGNLSFKNPSFIDPDGFLTLSNNYIKYSVIERDPTTGLTNEFQLGSDTQTNTFSFQHTVSQYSEIYLKIVAGSDFDFQAPITFHLDNIKVSEVKTSTQTYDTLGRIDENNVGTYNYTNTSKQFQNTSVELNTESNNYFQNNRNTLDITYNAFKSPIDIVEEGKDKFSFIYNMNNSRSTMYYGSLEADKLSRRFRKHYAADGSMEIKQDMVNGSVEFITYIGGDAYSAPIILKSDGTTQNYLYLHRDYLGSIVAVTNQAGDVVEKRLFDAWGNIAKVQDGSGNNLTKLTVIERGYTGHEHLQGVNLIHMNGRLYDPVVHRFLQPDNFVSDPQNTQAFNRYSYVLNNPLKYSDASGELPVLVAAAIIGGMMGAASYVATAIQTGDWSWGQFGMSIGIGAIVGAIAPQSLFAYSSVGSAVFSSFAAGFMPVISVPIGDWSISASPSIAFGNAAGGGVSLGVTYDDDNFSVSGGYGLMEYSNYNGFGANSHEFRYSALVSYDDGKTGFSLGTNFWRGDIKQQTGVFGLHSGDVNLTYENDGMPFGILGDDGKHEWFSPRLGNGGDSFRTAAASLSIGEYSLNVNLFTGKRDASSYQNEKSGDWDGTKGDKGLISSGKYHETYKFGLADEKGTRHRLGALSVGYKGYKLGANSEWVRHYVQNVAIHGVVAKQRMFLMTSNSWNGYFQNNTPNIFTSW